MTPTKRFAFASGGQYDSCMNPYADDDSPIEAELANPYRSPTQPSMKQDRPPLSFTETLSHATKCLVLCLITVVGSLMAWLIADPEKRLVGIASLAVAIIAFICWSAAVHEWRTASKKRGR